MVFPDLNVGYICGYKSYVTPEGIMVTFLGDAVKINFKFDHIASMSRGVYRGGRISWDVIRWGKCPPGTEAVRLELKHGVFKNHWIVLPDIEIAMKNWKLFLPDEALKT